MLVASYSTVYHMALESRDLSSLPTKCLEVPFIFLTQSPKKSSQYSLLPGRGQRTFYLELANAPLKNAEIISSVKIPLYST